MTAVINAERRFCRSKIMGQRYFAGVTLNKSNTVIMGVHNGELQIVMERQITYKRVMMESSLSLLFLFFLFFKNGVNHSYRCQKNIKNKSSISSCHRQTD